MSTRAVRKREAAVTVSASKTAPAVTTPEGGGQPHFRPDIFVFVPGVGPGPGASDDAVDDRVRDLRGRGQAHGSGSGHGFVRLPHGDHLHEQVGLLGGQGRSVEQSGGLWGGDHGDLRHDVRRFLR